MAYGDIMGRAGQISGAGATDALFLKQFSGEVLAAFDEFNVMMPLHTVRTISQGKSAQFPVIGTTSADYHIAGTSVIDDAGANNGAAAKTEYDYAAIGHAEKVIGIDDMLVVPQLIPSIDEAKSHYDYRSEYTRQMGAALARQTDKHLLRTLISAAEISGLSAPYTNGGGQIQIGTDGQEKEITSATLVASLFEAAAKLDGADVPAQDRFVILTPTLYYNLLSGGNSTYSMTASVANSDIGGSGFGSGQVPMIAGFEIYKSNNVKHDDTHYDSPSGMSSLNDYSGEPEDDVLGIVFHKSAVGTVKLMDLSVESEYLIERQSTLMVAKYAMGHGILRPESSVILTLAA